MKVIKKSGKKEEFLSDKLASSIVRANQNTEEKIDIKSLLAEFNWISSEKTMITTKQIDIIVYGLLYSRGHLQTLISYFSYDEKDRL